jgi:hypothetical protein
MRELLLGGNVLQGIGVKGHFGLQQYRRRKVTPQSGAAKKR